MLYTETYRDLITGEIITTAPIPLHRVAENFDDFVNGTRYQLISIDKEPFPLEIGDEVCAPLASGGDVFLIVTQIHEERNEFSGIRLDGAIYCDRSIDQWQKTGRHVDILHFINSDKAE